MISDVGFWIQGVCHHLGHAWKGLSCRHSTKARKKGKKKILN